MGRTPIYGVCRHMTICCSTGHAFCLTDSQIGYISHPLSLEELYFFLKFVSGVGSILAQEQDS